MVVRILSAVVSLGLLSSGLLAGDWPQYAGPDRNNISTETGLISEWPAEGPKVLWTFPLGPGYGGAAIGDGKVYVLDRVDRQIRVARATFNDLRQQRGP